MSTVIEIEQAIETLRRPGTPRLLAWLDERRASEVDARLEAAIHAGHFDPLAQLAERDLATGETVPLQDFLLDPH